jgi:NAD(P)-dependent dehydrogenase (short-subunit alcohol dehydrogenase family)
MKLLVGKTAVITGSSRGLGFAIALAFAQEGARVVLAARSEKVLMQAVDQLKAQGYDAIGMVCDTSNLQDVESLASKAVSTFGRLDIWVNNAGVSGPYGTTISLSPERFKRVVDTNILGTYYGSYAVMGIFLAQGSGKLINLLGRGADGPVPFQNAYASSKAWVKSFTRSLAKEYAKSGVEIMAFNPGLTITDMLTQVVVVPGFEKAVAPLSTVMQIWGNPPEMPAQKAMWMASSATDGKTGLMVNYLSPWKMMTGLGRELVRRIMGKPATVPPMHIHTVEK